MWLTCWPCPEQTMRNAHRSNRIKNGFSVRSLHAAKPHELPCEERTLVWLPSLFLSLFISFSLSLSVLLSLSYLLGKHNWKLAFALGVANNWKEPPPPSENPQSDRNNCGCCCCRWAAAAGDAQECNRCNRCRFQVGTCMCPRGSPGPAPAQTSDMFATLRRRTVAQRWFALEMQAYIKHKFSQ